MYSKSSFYFYLDSSRTPLFGKKPGELQDQWSSIFVSASQTTGHTKFEMALYKSPKTWAVKSQEKFEFDENIFIIHIDKCPDKTKLGDKL